MKNLLFKNKSLNYKIEKEFSQYLLNTGFYKLSNPELYFFQKKINNLKKKYDIDIDINIVKSIRASYIKQKIINKHPEILKNKNKIISQYYSTKPNNNILKLSEEYDYPPVNLLRVSFAYVS